MSNFPNSLDDDITLPIVNNNITEIGDEAINSLRDATFNIEENIGLQANGSANSIADRLGVSLNPDGTIKPSAIASLGLITLPITNNQIAPNANIPESKLHLDHRTQDLYNYIQDLSRGVNTAVGWISITGSQLDPHLLGALYRHTLDQIDISSNAANFLKNKFRALRDNTNFYTLISDINNELLEHQFADGSLFGTIENITTNDGSTYPSNYAHTASGIFLNTSRFAVIPQTAQDLQQFAEFIDSSSIFLYGTRIQNLYTNGISRISRSANLLADGYGSTIIPPTTAISYLLNSGVSSSPVDDINTGDDIIEFKPAAADIISNLFDEKFALVKAGDIIRINYGTVETSFIIKEKKYLQSGGNKKYIVRIAGKNLFFNNNATARIDRSLVNDNKFGVLAIAAANNNFAQLPSLIVGNPRGAQALGLDFNPEQFDSTHYLLYLALYPTGNPEDGYTILPGIDITGNRGATPGLYTLDSIVQSTNNAFRQPGFNYRFIAFSYQGNFGIMLADSYNNAGFSILNVVVAPDGSLDQFGTSIAFQNNVIGMFANVNAVAPDPLGFGPLKAGIASPPFMGVYGSPEAAINPTKLFLPLQRNNYYVNGTEKERLISDVNQLLDSHGDGYWKASVIAQNIFPSPNGHVETTYRILEDLSTSGLKVGKTLVIQSIGNGSLIDFGRFIVQNLTFGGCASNIYTDITVYDAVHATGASPATTLPINSEVGLYFSADSVSFNTETATDFNISSPFKRYFEIFVDQDGKTFTHERARFYLNNGSIVINNVPLFSNSELIKLDLVKVSPKLKGYLFGSVSKITLNVANYDSITGILDGYLASFDGVSLKNLGATVSGKKGEIVRFYDESNIDFIDITFDINQSINNISNQIIDIQLFPTLALDDQVMLLATCQVNDITKVVNQIRDERQFGNTSEKDLSTSALNFISLPEKLLHNNGVIKGFELDSSLINPNNNQIFLTGGVALVNGKIIQINNQAMTIPLVKELNGTLFNVNWAVCVNDKGELQCIPLLDFDPLVGTPSNPNRIFKAYSSVSGTVYSLDAIIFNDLINTRKDLTVLYIATSFINNNSLAVSDARRFVYSDTNNIPLTWVDPDSGISGSFQSFPAVISWINKFGAQNNTVIVKGNFNFNTSLDFTNILHPVAFKGENANINITSSIGFKVGKNISFENINFNYNPVSFNITGLINGDAGCIFGDTAEDTGNVNITDISITNCSFTSATNQHPPFICLRVNEEQFIDSINIIGNKFNDINSTRDCAIAFIGTFEGAGFTFIPTIANILVDSNICLQNQSFYFVNSFTLLGLGAPGLGCSNVKIINNNVGYIGYGISSNFNINDNIRGSKLHSFIIENNTAIAIVAPVSDVGILISNPNCPSGEVVINNNQLNFIQSVWMEKTTDGNASLTISNNNLHAADFNDIIAFGTSGSSTGIYVVNNTNTTSGNLKINVCHNNICSNTKNSITYHYTKGIYLAGGCAASIYHNTITGLAEDVNNSVGIHTGQVQSGKFDIYNNYIYRNGADIKNYILSENIGTTGNIVDNFLDTGFINAANNISTTISASSGVNVDRNINQLFTVNVRGRNTGRFLLRDTGVDHLFGDLQYTLSATHLTFSQLSAADTDLAGAQVQIGTNVKITGNATTSGFSGVWTVNLHDVLPQGSIVKFISIIAGTDAGLTSGSVVMELKRHSVYPAADTDVQSPVTFNAASGSAGSSTIFMTNLSERISNSDNTRLYVNVVITGNASSLGNITVGSLLITYSY